VKSGGEMEVEICRRRNTNTNVLNLEVELNQNPILRSGGTLVKLKGFTEAEFTIFDSTGKIVHTETMEQNKLHFTTPTYIFGLMFPKSGVYFVQLRSGDQKKVVKLLVLE
jgi:hypothetical protein